MPCISGIAVPSAVALARALELFGAFFGSLLHGYSYTVGLRSSTPPQSEQVVMPLWYSAPQRGQAGS